MFKDDYKSANEQITASSDLKKRTLEIINAPKQSKFTPYLRYGLICASFLFVVAIFPVLYGLDGITNDKSAPLMANGQVGEMMPQTGIEDSSTTSLSEQAQGSASLDEKPKGLSENSIKEVQPAPPAQENKAVESKKIISELNKVQSAVTEKIKLFAQPMLADKISFNELTETTVQIKPKDFPTDEGYYEEQWTNKQVLEYLGSSPIPSYIPKDLTIGLKEIESTTQKVVFNKDTSIAYDTFSYSILEPQLTKEVNPIRRELLVSVAKDKLPIDCSIYMKDDAQISYVKGCELKLGILKKAYAYNENKEPTAFYDRCVAEFILNGNGYRIITDSLTEKEFTDVITSIIVPISQ